MIDINEEYKDMRWEDVVDDGTAESLYTFKEDIPQVVLFKGPFGCGKNLLAYLLARELPHPEIHVRNTADNTAKGAEDLIIQYSSPPLLPDVHQVCVLNEFTLFRKDAQAKFKDIFQAPPRRTYFFVCTNEPEGIIPDIYNRFRLVVEVSRLNEAKAYELADRLCVKFQVGLHKKTKLAIAKGSGGVPRTIRNVIKAIGQSKDGSEAFINKMLSQYAVGDSHKEYMELFYFLKSKRGGFVNRDTLKKKFEATGMDAETFRFKTLGMIYNSFIGDADAYAIYLELLPPLRKGVEKHDLFVRLVRLADQS